MGGKYDPTQVGYLGFQCLDRRGADRLQGTGGKCRCSDYSKRDRYLYQMHVRISLVSRFYGFVGRCFV